MYSALVLVNDTAKKSHEKSPEARPTEKEAGQLLLCEKFSPNDVAETVGLYNLLRVNGFLIIEHKYGVELTDDRFFLLKRRKFGQTEVTFYARKKIE